MPGIDASQSGTFKIGGDIEINRLGYPRDASAARL
jgi:hypothetical protein